VFQEVLSTAIAASARLALGRCLPFDFLQKRIVLHRARKHRIILLDGQALLFVTQGRRAVLKGDYIEAFFIAGSHGGLNTTIREKATQRNGSDPSTAEDKIQVRTGERIQPAFALNDNILRCWCQLLYNLRSPGALTERLALHGYRHPSPFHHRRARIMANLWQEEYMR